MNKQAIMDNYLQQLEAKLQESKQVLAATKKDISEAPTRMESRYDSSKIETSWIANGQMLLVRNLERSIELVHSDREIANINSIVKVSSLDYAKNNEKIYEKQYKISSSRNSVSAEDVTTLSSNSELGNKLIGTTVDDLIEYKVGNKTELLQVVSIQNGTFDEPAVGINSLVCVKEKGWNDEEWYLITNTEGGIEIEQDTQVIVVVSKAAPLAKELIGKRVGDTFIFAQGHVERELEVVNVM